MDSNGNLFDQADFCIKKYKCYLLYIYAFQTFKNQLYHFFFHTFLIPSEDLWKNIFWIFIKLGVKPQALFRDLICNIVHRLGFEIYPEEEPTQFIEFHKLLTFLDKFLKENPEKQLEIKEKLVYLSFFLMDIFQESSDINPTKETLFSDLYKNPTDKINEKMILFFKESLTILKESQNNYNLSKYIPKILNIFCQDMHQKAINKDFLKNTRNLIIKTAENCFELVKLLTSVKLENTSVSKIIDLLLAEFVFFIANDDEIKQMFIERQVLKDLVMIKSLISIKLNEPDYLESLFKLLEILCFDKELFFFNISKEILNVFYIKDEAKFYKKIHIKEFDTICSSLYQKNKPIFILAFIQLCQVKMNKNAEYVVKLRKEIHEKPDIVNSIKIHINENTRKTLKQLADSIINIFLEELTLYKLNQKFNFVFTSDYLLKFLIIMKTEYPMLFELLNNIPVDLTKENEENFISFGFPPLDFQKASFHDFFFNAIIGFGFGVYNSYLIDLNITKKFSLGFIRLRDKILPKEACNLCQIIRILLKNIIFFAKIHLNKNFASGLILWNLTNFLLNSLSKLSTYPSLEDQYEGLLKESIFVLCELLRHAEKENLIILQALEIDHRLGLLHKRQMELIFIKKAKQLGVKKTMKVKYAKYCFQKHLQDLFESPDKLKERAFPKQEKANTLISDFQIENNVDNFVEKIKENEINTVYEFINRNDYTPLNTCMENHTMIFTQFLQKSTKSIALNQPTSVLDTLYDKKHWNSDNRKEILDFYNKLTSNFDRFRNGISIKIFTQTYQHSFLVNLKHFEKNKKINENDSKYSKSLIEFIEIYQKTHCSYLVSKTNKSEKQLENNPRLDIPPKIEEKLKIIDLTKSIEIKEELNKLKKAQLDLDLNKNKTKEETKTTEESQEEHKYSNRDIEKDDSPIPNPLKLTKKDYKFLEKYYFLLEIDKPLFESLTFLEQTHLLGKKYLEYIEKLASKYQSSHTINVKHEREYLTFLMCEKYLSSEEDQYMYNELEELKFLLNSLKKAKISKPSIPNDEIMEIGQNIFKENDSFSLGVKLPLEKFIEFDINKTTEKKRYPVFDKNYLEEIDNSPENKLKKKTDFIQTDSQLSDIYSFDFFAETFEVDDDILCKLFCMLCYSCPCIVAINTIVNSGFKSNNFRNRSTLILLKTLCFNYRNFIRIAYYFSVLLDQKSFFARVKADFPPDKPCFSDGKDIDNKQKYFSHIHALISYIAINFIKLNIGSNYFLHIDTNPLKRDISIDFLKKINCSKTFTNENSSILAKIFSFYVKEFDSIEYVVDFDLGKGLIKAIFHNKILSEQIPKEIIENRNNSLFIYPFYMANECSDTPDDNFLREFVLKNNEIFYNKKIKVSDNFISLLCKNSAITIISSLSSKVLPNLLNEVSKNYDDLNLNLMKNKEKLQEDMKIRPLELSDISNAVSIVNTNIPKIIPSFVQKNKDFCIFIQNIIKLAKKSLENVANSLRSQFQKNSQKDLKEIQEKFQEFEKDFNELVRFLFMNNKQFIALFMQILNVFITVEEIIKLLPTIKTSQIISIFEIYCRIAPALKAFFRVFSYLELKELDRKNKEKDIDFLINDEKLPELKRIQTKEISGQYYDLHSLNIEKSISNIMKKENFVFDEVFNLIYKVQDSMEEILRRVGSDRSPSIYRIFFLKHDINKINLLSKMEYIKLNNYLNTFTNLRKETVYRAIKASPSNQDCGVSINRKNVFNSTFIALKSVPTKNLSQLLFQINFEGEVGIDGGGLTREWITLLGANIFDPDMGLFTLSSNKLAVQPNPFSFIVCNHLNIFKFIGNMIGKIMLMEEENSFGVTFTKSFLKLLLDKQLNINDFEDIDPQVYKNLLWILENDISELDQTFCYFTKFFDKTYCLDLIENGRNIPLTEENKKDYVKAFCLAKMNKEIRTQTHTIMKGILEIIPHDLMDFFNESELGILLSGITTIDVNDMRETANLNGYKKDCDLLRWLWEILEEYTNVQRASFHFFISGAFRPPFGGFKNNPIIITKLNNTNKLPIAHTCSRNMELPDYSSKEILREKLGFAVFEGCSSYEFG